MLGGPWPGPGNIRMRDAGKDAGRDKVQAILDHNGAGKPGVPGLVPGGKRDPENFFLFSINGSQGTSSEWLPRTHPTHWIPRDAQPITIPIPSFSVTIHTQF